MLKVGRQNAVELDDGSLQVVIVISPRDRTAFFEVSPTPGTPFLLSADDDDDEVVLGADAGVSVDMPPAQSVAVAGFDSHRAMGASAEEARLYMLCSHPPFQSWIEEQKERNSGGVDSVQWSIAIALREMGIKHPNEVESHAIRFVGLTREYAMWAMKRSSENPMPW